MNGLLFLMLIIIFLVLIVYDFVNHYGKGKCDRRTDNIPTGFEIRSRDSIINPLIMQKIESAFSLFHYESLLSKVYCRDTRDSSS